MFRMIPVVSGELFINIARSMITLVVGLFLYQQTGSLWAFALAFFSEFVVAIAIQGIAGTIVDNKGYRNVLLIALLMSSLAVLMCTVLLYFGSYPSIAALGCVFLLNVIRPFIRASVFALIGGEFERNTLEKVNGYLGIARQSGQVVGMVLTGIILEVAMPLIAFATIFLCFFCGTICYGVHFLSSKATKPENEATQGSASTVDGGYLSLVKDRHLLRITLLGAIDFALIAIFNLLLAPVVANNLDNKARWLTIIDVSYAIGAIIAGIYITRKATELGENRRYTLLSILSAALLFSVYSVDASDISIVVFSLCFGYFSTLSVIVWSTVLQKASPSQLRGRVASIRYAINASFVALSVGVVSFANEYSFTHATQMAVISTVILFVFCLVVFQQRWDPRLVNEDDKPVTNVV
jgi:MFS family permease